METITKLQEARDANDWSQAKLAEKAGVHTNTIIKLEGRRGKVNHKTGKKIVEALGFQLHEIFEGAKKLNAL